MDLRRLRYFLVVAEELNFSRAARRLRISQPPLSKHMKLLEAELGVQLFDRTRRSIRLTPAGQLLLDEAPQVFERIEQIAHMVRAADAGKIGHLSLGFIPAASNDLLPRILRRFRTLYPEVELLLHEMMPGQALRSLVEKQIDVSFAFLPFENDLVRGKTISSEPLLVAVPETHRLASAERVKLPDLADEPFILPARYQTPSLYDKILEVCGEAGFIPRTVQKEVGLMQTIVGLVAGEIGVAFVPASLQNLTRKGIVYKEVQDPAPVVDMGVIWRREDDNPTVAAFLESVDSVILETEVDRD